MTSFDDSDVLKILQNSVKDAISNSVDPTIPVKFLGRVFTKPENGKYVEVVFTPNNVDNYWGEETLFQGIFNLGLHWPLDDTGFYKPMELTASIASHYRKSEPLQAGGLALQVYQKPKTGGAIPSEVDNMFPVTIFYRSFQP